MGAEGSVTINLGKLKKGDQAAALPLWDRYFPWLVGLARRKLSFKLSGGADEEDVALGAFAKFCKCAEQGRLTDVRNRDEVWRLLVTLTVRTAIDEVRRERRQKRCGTARAADEYLPGAMLADEFPAEHVTSNEPLPDFVVQVAEECERLLGALNDDELKAIAVWKTEGHTNDEIAVMLGVVLRTVERKLHLIRELWAADAPLDERRASQ